MDETTDGIMNGLIELGMGVWTLIGILVVAAIIYSLSKKRPK